MSRCHYDASGIARKILEALDHKTIADIDVVATAFRVVCTVAELRLLAETYRGPALAVARPKKAGRVGRE